MDDVAVEPEALEIDDRDFLDNDARKEIMLNDAEKPRVVKEATEAITNYVFQNANQLVRPMKTLDGVTIMPITPEALDLLLNQVCRFRKPNMRGRGARLGEPVDCGCPPWLTKTLCKLQKWAKIRILDSVTRVPYLRPNRTIGGLQDGYDGPSRCWSIGGKRWLEVSESPTDDEAKGALAVLTDVVAEFPFTDLSGVAVFLAAVLSIVARRAIKGHVPLIAIDASAPGSGKTLLASVIAMIATGKMPGISSATKDDEELRKAILGHLSGGETVIVFDNCTGRFGGAVMDRWITATVWSDRLLKENRIVSLPNECVVIMTGNNSRVEGDTATRTISISLRPNCERPEERTFRNPILLKYVEDRQCELIHAALTILRWHIAKGMPEYSQCVHIDADGNSSQAAVKPFGRFEEWSRLVRHAIIGLGLPDPVQSAEAIRKVDEASAQRKAFLGALAAWKPNWEGTANSLVEELYKTGDDSKFEIRALKAATEVLVGDKRVAGQPPSAKDLGYRFRDFKERFYAGLTLRWAGHRVDGTVYRLETKPPG